MNRSLFSICLCGFIILTGCGSSQNREENHVALASAFEKQEILKASDYFSTVRYVPLETTEESVIGKDAEIHFVGDRILVTTAQGQCLLFEKNTGKFLRKVGHRGEDPEGYSNATAWIDHRTEMIYLESSKAWVVYDKEGYFSKRISNPVSSGVSAYAFRDDGTYIAYRNEMFNPEEEKILFFNENEILESFRVRQDADLPFNVSDIASISVLKGGEDGYKQFGSPTLKGIIDLSFKEADKGFVQLIGATHLWNADDKLYLKVDFNDTIYQVKPTGLIPAKMLDLGEYHWSWNEQFNKDQDRSFRITHIMECEDYMFVRFVQHIYHADKRTPYTAVLNKKNGTLKIAPVEKGLEDDLNHFFPLQPYTVSPSGEYAGFIQAFDVTEWLGDNAGKTLSPVIEHLKQVGEEDNPVLVLMEK